MVGVIAAEPPPEHTARLLRNSNTQRRRLSGPISRGYHAGEVGVDAVVGGEFGVERRAEDVALTYEHAVAVVTREHALATWYLHGNPPFVLKDIGRAFDLLKEAAAAQVPDALYDLAVGYEKGPRSLFDSRQNFFKE
jgi:TPR repeat protein